MVKGRPKESASLPPPISTSLAKDKGQRQQIRTNTFLGGLGSTFVSNVFKKVSKRARKAVRSVLPVPLSTKLVEFSVNGVLLPAFLWVLKAFLEVISGRMNSMTPLYGLARSLQLDFSFLEL
ncbi:hypothetical protein NC652_023472 [Populus alba x Populus x berolinensis]|nr:hypothetical protein NC652_023472 [Populus alba x Populus x berolinensis]